MSEPGTDLLLALDSGSQSSRAILFSSEGDVLAQAGRAHQPMLHPQPGAVEQDALDICRCLFESIKACLGAWGGDPKQIAGAALTTQRNTILPVGAEGVPLGNAVSWLDRRSADFSATRSRSFKAAVKVLGRDSLIPRLLSKSVPRMWSERQPELMDSIRWVAPLEAWLHYQLCGEMAVAPGGLAGIWPFDPKSRRWQDSDLQLKLLAFRRSWLPQIVEAGQRIGGVTPEAAEATGLPPGLPLIACGGDKQAETLGAGVRPGPTGQAAVSLGTGSSICVTSKRAKAHPWYRWLTVAAAEAGAWQLEYMVFRGFWTVGWFAREFGRDLIGRAKAEGTAVEALLCEEAALIPPGSGELITWPRWSPSLQEPTEVGTILGLKETHSRGHLFRSLLEGLAFDLRRGCEILEGAQGAPITSLCVGGGGSRSDLSVQILAAVLNLPVRRPSSEELSARGAAIVAAAGSGVHPSVDAAVAAMVPMDPPLVLPDAAAARRYEAIYRELYKPGLSQLLHLSRPLAALRGR